jgi:hypothetical protein
MAWISLVKLNSWQIKKLQEFTNTLITKEYKTPTGELIVFGTVEITKENEKDLLELLENEQIRYLTENDLSKEPKKLHRI